MAERMGNMQQGGYNKIIFSTRAGQTRDKNNTKQEANSRAERTRKNEGLPPPVQPKGRREMYMRPQRSTMVHLLFHCDKTSTQREALIHQTSQQ